MASGFKLNVDISNLQNSFRSEPICNITESYPFCSAGLFHFAQNDSSNGTLEEDGVTTRVHIQFPAANDAKRQVNTKYR